MSKEREASRTLIRGPDGVYRYRRRVPADIQSILRRLDAEGGGRSPKLFRTEEKHRLGRDERQARDAWQRFDREVEERWTHLRSGQALRLSVVQRQALAGQIYRDILKRFADDDHHTRFSAWAMEANLEKLDAAKRMALPASEWPVKEDGRKPTFDEWMIDTYGAQVDAVLANKGLIVGEHCRWELLDAAHRAARHAMEVIKRRLDGDLRPDPDENRYPDWPDPRTSTLMGLVDFWVLTQKPKASTVRSFRARAKDLVAFLGFDDVARLTKDDVRKWCVSLRMSGMTDIRIRDGYLAAVKAILSAAESEGVIKANVAAGVTVSVVPKEEIREKDLNDREVFAILRASLAPPDNRASEDVRNARRWVPWLLAYTGARVGEITRLEKRHIIREEDVDGIHIERSKTAKMRKVPIHQHLKDQGFLRFVNGRNEGPLFFSAEKLSKQGELAIHQTRAEGLAEWIRKIPGMADPHVAPQHGWRHRFRTECRRVAMDREITAYLQGHAIETVGDGYGHIPLAVTGPWMAMFPYFDVDGDKLAVHRRFDVSLLANAVMRLSAYSEFKTFGRAA